MFVVLSVATLGVAACAAALALHHLPRLPRRDLLALAALLSLALVVSLQVPWGPHDIRSRDVAAFLPGWRVPWDHGVGHLALVRALQAPGLGPHDETELMALGPYLRLLTLAGFFVWSRALGVGRRSALYAGVLLALWGVDLRFAPTDAPQIAENACVALFLAALAVTARAPSWLAALTAGGLLGLGSTQRPEGMLLPLVLLPVALLTLPAPAWRDRRVQAGMALAALLAAPHAAGLWLTYGGQAVEKATSGGSAWAWREGAAHFLPFHPTLGSVGLGGLVVLGLVAGSLGPVPRGVVLATALVLALLVPGWTPAEDHSLGIARHALRSLPWFALLGGLGAGRLHTDGGRFGTVLAVLTVLYATASTWDHALRPATVDAEYRFVADTLSDLPPGCTVWAADAPLDGGLVPPGALVAQRRLPLTWRNVVPATPPPAATCTLVYRGAACVSHRLPSSLCGPWEGLVPLVEADLPARGWIHETYSTDPVTVGFYWLVRPPDR